jgi:hypothetical protein
MNPIKSRHKRLRLYAKDAGITIFGDFSVHGERLTSDEFRRLVGRLIRGIPAMLAGLPFCDFGIDNIKIQRMKG